MEKYFATLEIMRYLSTDIIVHLPDSLNETKGKGQHL